MKLLLISPVAPGPLGNNPSVIGHAVMLVFPLVKTHEFMQVASVDQLFMKLLYYKTTITYCTCQERGMKRRFQRRGKNYMYNFVIEPVTAYSQQKDKSDQQNRQEDARSLRTE